MSPSVSSSANFIHKQCLTVGGYTVFKYSGTFQGNDTQHLLVAVHHEQATPVSSGWAIIMGDLGDALQKAASALRVKLRPDAKTCRAGNHGSFVEISAMQRNSDTIPWQLQFVFKGPRAQPGDEAPLPQFWRISPHRYADMLELLDAIAGVSNQGTETIELSPFVPGLFLPVISPVSLPIVNQVLGIYRERAADNTEWVSDDFGLFANIIVESMDQFGIDLAACACPETTNPLSQDHKLNWSRQCPACRAA